MAWAGTKGGVIDAGVNFVRQGTREKSKERNRENPICTSRYFKECDGRWTPTHSPLLFLKKYLTNILTEK